MWSSIRGIFTNRIGWFLAVVHLCLTVYDFAQKSPLNYDLNNCEPPPNFAGHYLIAGRYFHFTNESLIHQVTILLDFPSLIVSGLVMIPISFLFPTNLCVYTESWIFAFVLLMVASLQWLIVGFIIQSIFFRPKKFV